MDNINDVLKLVIQVFLPGFSEKTIASYSKISFVHSIQHSNYAKQIFASLVIRYFILQRVDKELTEDQNFAAFVFNRSQASS